MTPRPSARLVGYFARSAPVCVIIRRGPSRYSQMIVWNTETDEFTPGQWMRGHVQRLTLTADGRYVAISVMGSRTRIGSWEDTQIHFVCRPPYFTALEVLIGALCWSGMEFLGDDTLCLGSVGGNAPHIVHAASPCPLKRTDNGAGLPLPYEHVIDASRGSATGTDQRAREVRFQQGRVYVVGAGGLKLLFDANPYGFEPIEAPDWAKDW